MAVLTVFRFYILKAVLLLMLLVPMEPWGERVEYKCKCK